MKEGRNGMGGPGGGIVEKKGGEVGVHEEEGARGGCSQLDSRRVRWAGPEKTGTG